VWQAGWWVLLLEVWGLLWQVGWWVLLCVVWGLQC